MLWLEGLTMETANPALDRFVTKSRVNYPYLVTPIVPSSGAGSVGLDRVRFPNSEAESSHVPSGERTVLLALKCTDTRTDRERLQRVAGRTWPSGGGEFAASGPATACKSLRNPPTTES